MQWSNGKGIFNVVDRQITNCLGMHSMVNTEFRIIDKKPQRVSDCRSSDETERTGPLYRDTRDKLKTFVPSRGMRPLLIAQTPEFSGHT